MPNTFSIVVLISGSGTTLKNLIEKKKAGQLVPEICKVIASKPDASGLKFAEQANIPHQVIHHRDFDNSAAFSEATFDAVRDSKADLVVLGGFLRRLRIPKDFENRIVNIHPSLIPSFCGKGHYGRKVHQAVIEYGCKISGCTVHFVDDHYDHGPIIAQEIVPVHESDDAEILAARVFERECDVYPKAINLIAEGKISLGGPNGRIVQIS